MNNTEIFSEYWPFLIPLIILQFALMITAVVHILKHPRYRLGNRTLWLIVVVLFLMVVPILYFAIGRGED